LFLQFHGYLEKLMAEFHQIWTGCYQTGTPGKYLDITGL